ncbi:Hsp20/alpha crystallin family protein [Methanofollis formosanus]|uniref:Hsp20/alpha crystallin family protein n=1 Tax=Methanofollis formosanus TaxID=299308 RepID=A0A8G1EHR5_9EURY|nr:Hsp20/alpha crystallin family protein [Methanofollis formosanus]QYZ80267.1 Hsp20/alpha crystallin family protein [Methanofollis formosanus]
MAEVKVAPVVYAMPDEDHEHLHIEVELPGVAKEDILLSMHDDSFFVRASKEGVRDVGSYASSYATCCPIDYEKAKAKYHNGLLVIDVPYKKPQERGIGIPIT